MPGVEEDAGKGGRARQRATTERDAEIGQVGKCRKGEGTVDALLRKGHITVEMAVYLQKGWKDWQDILRVPSS